MGIFSKSRSNKKKEPLIISSNNNNNDIDAEPVLLRNPTRDQDDELIQGRPAWSDVDGTKAAKLNDPEEGGDTDLTLPPGYRSELVDKRKTLRERLARFLDQMIYWGSILLSCGGASKLVLLAIYSSLAVVTAAVVLYAATSSAHRVKNVAFIGNSYFFVNDLPRLFESVTDYKIHQDSCLHGSGSILNILKTGNGMYYKWKSANAMQGGIEWMTEGNVRTYLYDYGACSVPQLLAGKDNMLSYGNQYGHYVDDGTNPCLQDNNYLDYENSKALSSSSSSSVVPPDWDHVVIVDQSKRMCFDDARQEAILGLNYTYGPLLDRIRTPATPVIVQPHAFWSDNVNMTGLTDVPTFTSMIMQGANIYKEFLDTKLTSHHHGHRTKIAPVGHAFLQVWEDDQDLWAKLFLDDGIHPSGYGSYLYAMVLHATIYGYMPPKSRVVTDDILTTLFGNARKLHSTSMPTKQEAAQLWKIARKVTVFHQHPSSLSRNPYADEAEANDDLDQSQVEYTDDAAATDDAAN